MQYLCGKGFETEDVHGKNGSKVKNKYIEKREYKKE